MRQAKAAKRAAFVLACLGLVAAPLSIMAGGECTARVVDVLPLTHYDPAQGSGFLAVRTGPGADFHQTGELYQGDLVAVQGRQGNWFAVACRAGNCAAPLRGEASPSGWVYGRFLRLDPFCR